jgi:hypothetical protein
MNAVRKRLSIVGAICVVLLGVFIVLYGFVDNGSAESKNPVSLIGEWHQTDSGIPDIYMTATIDADSIQINMKMKDAAGVYWLGTFNVDEDLSKPVKIVSQADADGMAMSIFSSTDKTKTFFYENGDLSYKFSIMGITTTVHLSK